MSVVANQNTYHYKDEDSSSLLSLILSFPFYGVSFLILDFCFNFLFSQILTTQLVFSWLKVADILNNPFGNDEAFDINLSDLLDFNIWRASVMLEQQEMPRVPNILKIPYHTL